MLNWRSLECPANRYLVKGSELAVAIVGPQSRFAIYEVRTREDDGFSGTRYVVRDATKISDADVKAGMRPPIVFSSNDPQDCEDYCVKATS